MTTESICYHLSWVSFFALKILLTTLKCRTPEPAFPSTPLVTDTLSNLKSRISTQALTKHAPPRARLLGAAPYIEPLVGLREFQTNNPARKVGRLAEYILPSRTNSS